MGRYYCDYCQVYLTHDSNSVRKAHMEGKKHKSCVREYYQAIEADIVQAVLATRIREFVEREAAIRAGMLPPNAPFTSCMPPHPLAPGLCPVLPPGYQIKIPEAKENVGGARDKRDNERVRY